MSSSRTSGLERWESKATGWSEWVPFNRDDLDYRGRMNDEGQWEYEYKKSDRSGNRVKIPSDKSRNVYTITNPSSIETVEQGVSDVSLNEEVHVIEDPNQGSSYVGQMEEMPREISREDQSLSRRITARNSPPHSKYVDTNYKVHRSTEFAFGKVLQLLWSEDNAERHGERAPIRRFVVVKASSHYCNVLPINSFYTMPKSYRILEHAVIYTSTSPPSPTSMEDERNLLAPIRMVPTDARHSLKSEYRVCYSRVYTVEYKVKVWFIGSIHRNSKQKLLDDYNRIHPPLGTSLDIIDAPTSEVTKATIPHAGISESYHSDSLAHLGMPNVYGTSYFQIQGLEPGYSQHIGEISSQNTEASPGAESTYDAYYKPELDEVAKVSEQEAIGNTNNMNRLTTVNKYTKSEPFDSRYKVHRSSDFKFGRIFKTIWSEPLGDQISTWQPVRHNQQLEVRRFVIVKPMQGHSICLAIRTYSGRGTTKPGVNPVYHTIIHTSNKPVYLSGENGLRLEPLKVEPDNSQFGILDSASRLNYAKIYTIEHNVKVWFVSKLALSAKRQLEVDYNRIHPPLGSSSIASYSGGGSSTGGGYYSSGSGGYHSSEGVDVSNSAASYDMGDPVSGFYQSYFGDQFAGYTESQTQSLHPSSSYQQGTYGNMTPYKNFPNKAIDTPSFEYTSGPSTTQEGGAEDDLYSANCTNLSPGGIQ